MKRKTIDLNGGEKRLDEKIDEGWEPCGEKEVKRVLCKVLLRVKETKRMVKKKGFRHLVIRGGPA